MKKEKRDKRCQEWPREAKRIKTVTMREKKERAEERRRERWRKVDIDEKRKDFKK